MNIGRMEKPNGKFGSRIYLLNNKNKIFITGATGFLGSSLVKQLVKNGYNVSILKRKKSNLTRLKDVENLITSFIIEEIDINACFEKIKPNIVIHCATNYGKNNAEPLQILESNLILPLKLLDACKTYNVQCFINTDTALEKNVSNYSLSKKQFRDWLIKYSKDLICVNIILEHFYGPYDDKTKFVSHVVDKLLSNSQEIDLTLGEQKRDFIYIDDVISAFDCVLNNIENKSNGFYEFGVGTNSEIMIKDFVLEIKKIIGNTQTKFNFGAIPYRENEIMNSDINTSEIRKLGWVPKYSISEGLKKMISLEKK